MQKPDVTDAAPMTAEAINGLDRFMPLEGENTGYGVAAYVGAKSTVCRLYNLQNGELAACTGASGDYANFSGAELKELMTDVFETLATSAGIELSKLKVAVVSGSTAMESKTANVEQEELVDDGSGESFGCDVEYMFVGSSSIAVGQAFFVPCLDPELGGDFLCSLLAIDMLGSEEPVLFINAGAGESSGVTLAYGNRDAISVGVLSEGADVEEGLKSLLSLCDAEYEHISHALISGESTFAVPEELLGHLRRIEYPAIVGTSAVLLSEAAEDELCNLVSECRFVRL